MAISGPGLGAAAGTVGQLLMQTALQNREREERERARQEAMVPQMLRAFMGPGERAQPLGAEAPLPEGGRELTVGGQRFAAIAPPPEPSFTARATRPGGVVQGAFATPEEAGEFTSRFGVPEPPKATELPFSVSAGGITSRYATPEEALAARKRFAPPQEGGGGQAGTMQERLNQRLAQNAMGANRVLNELDQELTGILPSVAARGGAITGGIANILTGERGQAAGTAALNFVNPAVRYLSGAQMNEQESRRYYRALIPQPGDKPPTVQLKELMRDELIRAMQSGQWQGQVGPNGEPDFANIDAFISRFQAGTLPGQEEAGIQLPGLGLSGGGQSSTPALDAFTDTTRAAPPAASDDIAGARQLVQGLSPDRARAALQQAGFGPDEIAQIVGS